MLYICHWDLILSEINQALKHKYNMVYLISETQNISKKQNKMLKSRKIDPFSDWKWIKRLRKGREQGEKKRWLKKIDLLYMWTNSWQGMQSSCIVNISTKKINIQTKRGKGAYLQFAQIKKAIAPFSNPEMLHFIESLEQKAWNVHVYIYQDVGPQEDPEQMLKIWFHWNFSGPGLGVAAIQPKEDKEATLL